MTSRKDFLLASAAGCAVPLASQAAQPVKPVERATLPGELPPLLFDRAAFEALLNTSAEHRQCFTSTKLQWDVLQQMTNSLNAYQQYYMETLHPVAVLYHGPSVGIALSNEVWDQLLRPAFPAMAKFGIKVDPDFAKGRGNPFLHATHDAGTNEDASVEHLVARGAHFFVCNNVLTGVSAMIAGAVKKSRASVYQQLRSGIVKGAMVVPAGVQAINAAQEAKFTLLPSTV